MLMMAERVFGWERGKSRQEVEGVGASALQGVTLHSVHCALCTAHTSTLPACNTSVCRGKVQKAHQAHQCTPDTMQVNLCTLQAQQGCQCWGGMPGKSIGRSCRFTQTTIKCLKLPF